MLNRFYMRLTSHAANSVVRNFSSLFGPRGESPTSQ